MSNVHYKDTSSDESSLDTVQSVQFVHMGQDEWLNFLCDFDINSKRKTDSKRKTEQEKTNYRDPFRYKATMEDTKKWNPQEKSATEDDLIRPGEILETSMRVQDFISYLHVTEYGAVTEEDPLTDKAARTHYYPQLRHLPVNHHQTLDLDSVKSFFCNPQLNPTLSMSGHWVFYVAPFEIVKSAGLDSNTNMPFNEPIKLVKMNSNTIKSKDSYGCVVSEKLQKFQKSLNPDPVPIYERGTAVRRRKLSLPKQIYFSVIDGLHRSMYLYWLMKYGTDHDKQEWEDTIIELRFIFKRVDESCASYCYRMKSVSLEMLKRTKNIADHTLGDIFMQAFSEFTFELEGEAATYSYLQDLIKLHFKDFLPENKTAANRTHYNSTMKTIQNIFYQNFNESFKNLCDTSIKHAFPKINKELDEKYKEEFRKFDVKYLTRPNRTLWTYDASPLNTRILLYYIYQIKTFLTIQVDEDSLTESLKTVLDKCSSHGGMILLREY